MSLDDDKKGLRLIAELVQGFSANIRTLRAEQTLEATVRQEYIDPFWQALGWDVANTAHRGAAEKDVVIEPSVATIERHRLRSRRPDYLFRIDGFPRFIVEAKRPAVDLATDCDAIFQAKTYAWSAQIPFALLTDFEEFRLFDATLKPDYDEPGRGLIEDFDLRYEDYPAQWDVLWKTFSRPAAAAGSLEQLLARIKRVRKGRPLRGVDRMLIDLRGSEPIDRAFLAHLEDYRERFAREIYRENRSHFPQAQTWHGAAKLTEAAQRLIDRLVFMRVCEDRDIGEWGELRGAVDRAVEEQAELYPILATRFRELDREYNGYLFKPHFSEQLNVPGQLLAYFIVSLYPPLGPYRFDAIGDDLLGIIYERFLGSVITVERGRVEVEQKPEVRHAGGVYYTPRFVVDTIIRRVVGPQLEGRTPLDVLDLKVLDPACGSGSFLIAAFQYLVDYCVRYITEHPDAAEIPATRRARKRTRPIAFADDDDEGQWHLAPEFKAQLLTSCLHGVDIDPQAVEVTIMSLYLKMLEGKLPPNWQRKWLDSALLPPLDNNIRCGNSLLSQTDFDRWWEDQHGNLFDGDEDTRFRMNPFDWTSHTRGFGRVHEDHGGFDAVIGNPPYIRVQELNKWAPDECAFYKWRYRAAAKGNYDIYVVFIERGLELLTPTGLLGFITPHKYWQAKYGEGLRELVADGKHLRSVIDFADQQVFRRATTYTAIQVFGKAEHPNGVAYARFVSLDDGDAQCAALDTKDKPSDVNAFLAIHPAGSTAWAFADRASYTWSRQIDDTTIRLGKVAEVFVGVQTSADKVYHLDVVHDKGARLVLRSRIDKKEWCLESEIFRPLLSGGDVRAFVANQTRQVILFPYEWTTTGTPRLLGKVELADRFPETWGYLRHHSRLLRGRERNKFDDENWYRFGRSQNIGRQKGQKLCVPRLAKRLRCTLEETGKACLDNVDVNGIRLSEHFRESLSVHYLCAILNSKLADRYIKANVTTHFRGGFASFNRQFIEQVPIKLPETASERRDADRIVERVRRIIEAKKRLQGTTLGQHERERLERQVEAHESGIDALVCRLYGVDEIPEP